MTSRSPLRRQLVVVLVVGGLVVWLHQLGRGVLAMPPLTISAVTSWFERDPVIAIFVVVRLVAMVLGVYVVVVVALSISTRACHLWRATQLIERLMVPWGRGLVGGAALLGVMAAPPTAHGSSTRAPAPVLETAVLHELGPAPDGGATLHPLGPVDVATPRDQPDSAPHTAPAAVDTWVVAQGDSFWSIARAHLTETMGRDVSDAEVDNYWRELIDGNRDQLVNPGDPDLIYAGQVFALPAIASG